MKMMGRVGAAAMVVLVATVACAAEQRTDLKAAFKAGQLKLMFTAKDKGATLELKITNQTKDKLLLVVPEGKTPFDVGGNQVSLVAAAATNVDLEPAGESTLTFPMEQSGGGRWTSGSVIQSMSPPSKPKE